MKNKQDPDANPKGAVQLHGYDLFRDGDIYTVASGATLKKYRKGQLLVPLGEANSRINTALEYQRNRDIEKLRKTDGIGSWQEAVESLEGLH